MRPETHVYTNHSISNIYTNSKIIHRPQLQKTLSYGRQIFSNETISEPP